MADLLTNTIIGELPLTNVNFTTMLNGVGSLSGEVLLSGVNSYALNVPTATLPSRTIVYVERNGQIVWGGVIWGRIYNSTNQLLSIQASEFESYYDRRRITTTQVYNNVDQFTIVNGLLTSIVGMTNGDIGVKLPTNLSGINVSRTYYSYEIKSVLAAIQDLSKLGTGAQGSYGFDFNIDCSYDSNGNIVRQWNLYSPMAGTRYSSTSLTTPVFEFPAGNVIEYEYTEDGPVANIVYGIGAGSNEGMNFSTSTNSNALATGWAALEDYVSYGDVYDSTSLQKLSDGALAAQSYPVTTIKLTTAPYVDPQYGSFNLGDDVRLRFRDDRFPTGLDAVYRVTGINVSPGENGPERMTLSLTLPTVGVI